ncbi:MAG: glutamate--tRNA ligase [Nanoarchaeota archaeon]
MVKNLKNFSNEIYAYALENAIEHGKTMSSVVMPKLFQHGLKKENIKDVMPEINKIVSEINSMPSGERDKLFNNYKKFLPEKFVEEKGLKELPNVSKKMVFRLAPEPSKYNHIGHALTFLLNYLYAKKYKGKCLLRFEDTNPEKVSQEYIDSMKEDVIDYLDIKVDSIRYVSDDMKKLYDYAEQIIKMGKAYICFCDRDKMQDLRHKGIECECRKKNVKQNMLEWKKFISGDYKEGEAILRIKGDMKSLNHVMRDSVMFRISSAQHYKYGTKYKAWPMYDFYNPIEDSIMGVTHILRSNEFDMRVELHDYIRNLLKLKSQTIVQYGRVNVIDAVTKGREIRDMIESGKFLGWDDPRLMTLRALKRRGIVKEVYYELAENLGLNKNQVNIDFDLIASISRKLLDKKANRYFFVEDPVELKIENAPNIKEIKVKFHPEENKMKTVELEKSIFVSNKDFNDFKGKNVRLMHLFNIKLDKKAKFISIENDPKIRKIHWVSKGVKTKIMMPKGFWKYGLAEENIEKLKKGEIIQFERFGFCKYEGKDRFNGDYEFWYTHD